MTTLTDREQHVAQMLTNHRIEGYEPDDADKQLQAAYIDGMATLDDLLAHARQFAAAASYDRWFARGIAQEQRETPKKGYGKCSGSRLKPAVLAFDAVFGSN